jgi:hypothetical protein
MQNRRFTRLTNAFSKKWQNHELMFALFVAWYNFCRPHHARRFADEMNRPGQCFTRA